MVACCSIKCQFFVLPVGIALQKEIFFICFRFSLVGGPVFKLTSARVLWTKLSGLHLSVIRGA